MTNTRFKPLGFKDLLTVAEFDAATALTLFGTAAGVKRDITPFAGALRGRAIILIFEKPSLRTRVTFEAGIARLGGHPIYYDHSTSKLGERESVHDYARNLERMVDMIVCRTHAHAPLAALAGYAGVPVVNALCEKYHPCQALADLFTMKEKLGELRGRRLAFLGDGNNVCHSLMLLAATLGVHVTVIGPEGYEPAADVVAETRRRAAAAKVSLTITPDLAAVEEADAVYTDTWVSMGFEPEQIRRREALAPYQVNDRVMTMAREGALFMHCLPANRGMEVTDSVMDSPASVVFQQAENRMHVQNALVLHMLAGAKPATARDVRSEGELKPRAVVSVRPRRKAASR